MIHAFEHCMCVCVHYAHRTTDETKIYWKCVASCKMKMSWIYSLWWILNCILGINATQWLISSALSGIQPARERKRRPTNRMHGKRGDKTGELKMFVILRPVKNEFCRLNMSWTHIYCTMQMCCESTEIMLCMQWMSQTDIGKVQFYRCRKWQSSTYPTTHTRTSRLNILFVSYNIHIIFGIL